MGDVYSLAEADNEELLTLPEIGEKIECLMGGAFRHHYTSKEFKARYCGHRGRSPLKRMASNLLIGRREADKPPVSFT